MLPGRRVSDRYQDDFEPDYNSPPRGGVVGNRHSGRDRRNRGQGPSTSRSLSHQGYLRRALLDEYGDRERVRARRMALQEAVDQVIDTVASGKDRTAIGEEIFDTLDAAYRDGVFENRSWAFEERVIQETLENCLQAAGLSGGNRRSRRRGGARDQGISGYRGGVSVPGEDFDDDYDDDDNEEGDYSDGLGVGRGYGGSGGWRPDDGRSGRGHGSSRRQGGRRFHGTHSSDHY